MGRKLRGAAFRAKKRSTEAAEEIVESTAVQVEEDVVRNKDDDDLFVLDTTAAAPSKKQRQKKQEKPQKRKYQASSAKEQAQIQKLVEGHPVDELKRLAEDGKVTARHAKIKGSVKPTFDLWGGGEDEAAVKRQKTNDDDGTRRPFRAAGIVPASHVRVATTRALPAPKSNAVSLDLATSGQSYNPDKREHKAAIEEALRVETKREFAEKEHKAPVSRGLSDETRALLLGDSDTESDTDDDDDDGDCNDAATTTAIQKRPEKLTRAQRNKQKRVRAELKEIRERKRQKKLQTAAGQAKTISKQLKKQEAAQKERKDHLEQLKAGKERVKGTNVYQQLAEENPRFAPTYPVALPGELKSANGGSLRTIKPKGSLVTDRMVSLMDRAMTAKKQLKKKMRVEGKRRKVKVRGKGYEATAEGDVLG